MLRSSALARRVAVLATAVAVAAMAVFVYGRQQSTAVGSQRETRTNTYNVARRDFVRSVRLNGTVEAVEFTTIAAPRLSGPASNSLIITKLVPAGSTVAQGRPDRRIRSSGPDQERPRQARRAARSRTADREARSRGARRTRPRRQRNHPRGERDRPGAAGDGQERDAAEDQRRKEHADARADAGDAGAAQGDIRAEAAGGRRRPARPPDPARPRRQGGAAGGRQRRPDVHPRADRRHGCRQDHLEGQQHGGGPGRRGGARRCSRRRHRQSERDARACAGQPGGYQRPAGRPAGPHRSRRLSRVVLQRPRRADIAARRDLDALAKRAHVRRAHRRRWLAPEPDAGSLGVARRHAGAVAGCDRRAAGRAPHRRRTGRSCAPQRGGGFEDRRSRSAASTRTKRCSAPASTRARSSPATCSPRQGGRNDGAPRRHRPAVRATSSLVPWSSASSRRAPTRPDEAPALPTCRPRWSARASSSTPLEIRGEIRPLKSIVLSSPMQSGELQILKLAKNGSMVKPGDVVVEFDPSTLQRTIQEKQSELKQADAEIEQAAGADADRAGTERDRADEGGLRHRARQARRRQGRHGLAARQRAGEARASSTRSRSSASSRRRSSPTRRRREADVSAKRRKREKALFDLQRAEQGLRNLAASGSRGRDGQHPAELPIGRHVRRPAGFSDRAIARGPARRSSSCPICRRSTSKHGSTNPIAAGCSPAGRDRPDRGRSRHGVQGAARQHLGARAGRLLVRLAAGEELRSRTWCSSTSIRGCGPA